ncbi:AAA family ATPase [Marinobacterium sediminicola]|uniref:AAA+-type ATPase, SpoVK/Ycf46/Vps4 family n=1 Tax=Marinobacterium sediminicola TaxID=518898 RepID=A0ABY1S2A1_9GAMM|nr:AAA family ATPase [Marinobacterium sediminicola]ULG68538.1 AAA family ATPase [Marinobacterium sediminicola]SMR76611.1 AAA+-type ATPase, SpoVK/Ycf46/Vps4 family [Marinobacterium sediminicola]
MEKNALPRQQSTRDTALKLSHNYLKRAALWSLRLLVDAHVYRFVIEDGRFCEDEILELVELRELRDQEVTPLRALQLFKSRQLELERENIQPALLDQNLSRLAKAIGMHRVEMEVLGFLCVTELHNGLKETLSKVSNEYGLPHVSQLAGLISVAIRQPRHLVLEALSVNGNLCRCRLLEFRDSGRDFKLLKSIDSVMLYETEGPQALLKYFTRQSNRTPELTPDDFAHISDRYKSLKSYLKAVIRSKQEGTNILLYGPPGTGKTELVHTLTSELGVDLFEVRYADSNGVFITGHGRFSAYLLSQQLLRVNVKSVLLFDEIEDVFTYREQTGQKAWINNLLEQNPRPTFWISNDIDTLDKAYLRRFDMIICMPELNEATRFVVVQRTLKGINVRESWMRKMARKQGLQPAHLSRAAKVVRRLRLRKPERVEQMMEQLLSSLYQALGYQWEHKERRPSQSRFNPGLSNTDFPLERLVEGLKRSGQGRVCLYGPPGTGKSELGRYLECVLKKPLLMKKASDLLGPYVGQTEQQMASAFVEAKEAGSILMIDEADSFLEPRSEARQHWEVSQVNELLVQMEQFDGILIMSTNFIEHLDSAALRRFDFKVRFDYLAFDQAWSFFNRLLGMHQTQPFSPVEVDGIAPRLKRLTQLTPGDFATVERRAKVLGEALTPEYLIAGLEQEHAIKTRHQPRAIGFIN